MLFPGAEGKAGMACIMDPGRCVKLEDFYLGVSKQLPPYARPLFVRICNHMELTGE